MKLLKKTTATLLILFLVSTMTIMVPVQAAIIDDRPNSYIDHTDAWNPFTIRPQINWPEDADRPRELSVVISGLSVSGDLYVGNTLTLSGTVDMTADPGIHGWWIHSAIACSYGDAKLTHDGTLLHYEPSPLKWAACDAEGGSSGWKWRIIPNDQSQTWTFTFDFTLEDPGTYTLTAFGHVDASYYRQHVDPENPGLSWYDSDNQADSMQFEVLPSIEVDIDIKPGSDPNSINLKSKGVVPVAVLTTIDFDSSDIDPNTVLFAGASPIRWTMEDIDDDGDLDILFHFKTQELNLDENSTEATLTGEVNAVLIEGTESVNIVPKK